MAPLIYAHRGATDAGAPANSMAALERAVELGVDGIEFDVRRTRDGALVLVHDPTAGGRRVADMTRGELGRALGHEAATLREALDLTSGRLGLDVEVKADGYVEEVLTEIDSFDGPLVLTSFLPTVLDQAKQRRPATRTGRNVGLRSLLARTRAEPDVLAVDRRLLRRDWGDRELWTWTVNSEAELRRAMGDPRLTVVITDFPVLATDVRSPP